MAIRYLSLIAVAAVLGCAAAGSSTSGARRNPAVITEEEIAAANVVTAYDAVERLRPLYLRSRGETSITTPGTQYANVYVDGLRHGDLNTLRNILANHVQLIRYYNGAEAGSRFGLANTAGVIEVIMK